MLVSNIPLWVLATEASPSHSIAFLSRCGEKRGEPQHLQEAGGELTPPQHTQTMPCCSVFKEPAPPAQKPLFPAPHLPAAELFSTKQALESERPHAELATKVTDAGAQHRCTPRCSPKAKPSASDGDGFDRRSHGRVQLCGAATLIPRESSSLLLPPFPVTDLIPKAIPILGNTKVTPLDINGGRAHTACFNPPWASAQAQHRQGMSPLSSRRPHVPPWEPAPSPKNTPQCPSWETAALASSGVLPSAELEHSAPLGRGSPWSKPCLGWIPHLQMRRALRMGPAAAPGQERGG